MIIQHLIMGKYKLQRASLSTVVFVDWKCSRY